MNDAERPITPAITLELFWVFERKSFPEREGGLKPVFQLLDDLPGVTWQRYDQNGMGLWKEFQPERATVDALTQRTAMVRVEGDDGAMAILALGKRGEPPTLIVRITTAAFDVLEKWWQDTLGSDLPSWERSGITPVAARDLYRKSGRGMASVAGVDVTCWWTAARNAAGSLLASSRVHTTKRSDATLARLLPAPDIAAEEAGSIWEEAAESLS